MNRLPHRPSSLALGVGCCLGFVVVLWLVTVMPPDMDEFSMFHRIACWYPNAYWHTFREGCNAYLLRFGSFEYHRSYEYIGVASSLFYYPFWRVWSGQASNYLLGTICLVAFSFGMTRALRLPAWCALIGVCYFPIAAIFLHDRGPVRLALLSVPALVLIARRAAATTSWAMLIVYASAAATCIVICLEDKIFYAQLVPLVGACVAACLWYSGPGWPSSKIRWFAAWIAATALLCAVGAAVLLTARSGPISYWDHLVVLSNDYRKSFWFEVSQSVLYTVLVPRYGSRIFDSGWLIRPTAIFWVMADAICAAWVWRTRAVDRRAAVLFLGAYVVGVMAFAIAGTTAAAHHFIFLHVPLIALLMVAARDGRAFARVLGFVGVSTLAAIALLSASPVNPSDARERVRMFAYLSRPDVAAQYVVNFSTWGGYYQQSLYGDRQQIVTFIDPANATDSARLVAVARATARDILDVCLACDRDPVAQFIGQAGVSAVDLGLTQWKVFRIAVPQASR